MGKKVKREDPSPDPRVHEIVTHSTDEFLDVCQRQRQGEFIIYRIAVGRTNASWVFSLRYEKPYTPQIDLL